MSPNSLIRTPRQLLILFLTLTILPAAALVWLGWTLLEQDRNLENSRIQERREGAADLIVAALQQSIVVVEQRLIDVNAARTLGVSDGQVVVLSPQGIETIPPRRLLYYPMRPSLPEASSDLFQSGEIDEFRAQNHDGAIAKFRELTRFPDAAVRAGALLRLARNLRKAGRFSEALDVYNELGGYDHVAIGGLPAGLVAQQARCAVLADLKKTGDLRREAAQLEMDLRRGRWQLDRAAYLHYATETATWLSTDPERETSESGEAHLAAIVDSLWARWDISKRDDAPAAGREIIPSTNETGIMVWHSSPERSVALIVEPSYIEREWMARLRPLLESQGLRVALGDSGKHSDGGFTTVRTPSDSGLPWKLVVETADPTADLAQSADRRRLILAGLSLLLVVVLAGSYFVAKSVRRELAVAALQSDFVAAVSHEFRTPLTSLRQVTEILTDGRVAEPNRLQTYYSMQARATARLHRLVESLLDFGRMEAGAKPYRMQKLSVSKLSRGVVEEFLQEVGADGYRIEFQAAEDLPEIDADPEALAHALRNLLDNAVKYSPAGRMVQVEVGREGSNVAIRVRDQGLGIPHDEQKAIFRKFVRGAASKTNGIKGTGIGLAIVDHIVRAHGGAIHLESRPDFGSTFTLLLPIGK